MTARAWCRAVQRRLRQLGERPAAAATLRWAYQRRLSVERVVVLVCAHRRVVARWLSNETIGVVI